MISTSSLKTSCEDAQKSMESGDSAGKNVAANLESTESGLAAAVNQHQTYPSEMREQDQQTSFELLDHSHPKEFKDELQKIPDVRDVVLGQSGPSGQGSRNINDVHDSWTDDETDCQTSGQMTSQERTEIEVTVNADSRNVEQNQPFFVSANNAETEEDCLQDLESSNLNNNAISSQITISDVLSRTTKIVVASEDPSENIVEDPT